MQASIDDTRATAMEQPPLKPGLERLMVNGPVAKAVVHVVWPTDDIYDMYRTHRLDLLAQMPRRAFAGGLTPEVRSGGHRDRLEHRERNLPR